MHEKIVYVDILKAAWKGFKSQCWLLMGLLIGFTIVFSLLWLFAFPAKDETVSISGIIVAFISFLLYCIFYMGYVKNSLQTLDGDEPQFSAYGQVSRKLPSFIPAHLIYAAVVAIGCALLVFPGLYLAVRLQFFYASMVDEDTGLVDSFKRSWNITKGHGKRLFVLMLCYLLIIITGLVAAGIGIFAAVPLIILMYGHAYRKLIAPASP